MKKALWLGLFAILIVSCASPPMAVMEKTETKKERVDPDSNRGYMHR